MTMCTIVFKTDQEGSQEQIIFYHFYNIVTKNDCKTHNFTLDFEIFMEW